MRIIPQIHSIFSYSRWFCHFDDDNYVNVPSLVRHLQRYDPNTEWYIGKTSIPKPLELLEKTKKVRDCGLTRRNGCFPEFKI